MDGVGEGVIDVGEGVTVVDGVGEGVIDVGEGVTVVDGVGEGVTGVGEDVVASHLKFTAASPTSSINSTRIS